MSSQDMLRSLETLEAAFSKNGVSQDVISFALPKINAEISEILDGIAGFTVEIECNDTNTVEIYLNYGDNRRLIELGSGMEKMISSIAIRVALTNISSLPKSSMLIIDEGFGTLDDNNLEACARLLTNLKSYFKNILVISHVDTIKDIVDNVIDIGWEDGFAKVTCD
jgi:DNA repair exonuclease SbcCD ATPase subunit